MNVEKKKMSNEQKVKLIYSGELLLFSIVFIVIGTLELTKVITISNTYRLIFNWVTIFGGTWLIADTIWTCASKKRRKKNSLIDKFIMLPLGMYLIVFDLYCLIVSPDVYDVYRFGMGIPFLYIALSYAFQGIFHYFYPIPGLLDNLNEQEKVEDKVVDVVEEKTSDLPIEEENDKKD